MSTYRMIGLDTNSHPRQYRSWTTDGYPDLTAEYYVGLKSGDDPLANICAYQIPDGYVGDFCLSDALSWVTANDFLPDEICDSQLAIIDGYVYLFGGRNSAAIYRASLDTPTNWEDTGATLPTQLSESQLAIVDGYIYLFGGREDEAVDTIFRALTSDPLSWTNEGSKLPQKLRNSQLGTTDGYLYLFGGQGINNAIDNIYMATEDDPLTWIDTGSQLPFKLYGSSIGSMDGYFYLIGGLGEDDFPDGYVYRAHSSDPTFWQIYSELPYPACYGQFCLLGNYGYFIAPSESDGYNTYLTKIFRCTANSGNDWIDIESFPGNCAQSQLAVIDDRLFLFGGNGTILIWAAEQVLNFSLSPSSDGYVYGDTTRIQLQAVTNPLDSISVLGLHYWKTSYTL